MSAISARVRAVVTSRRTHVGATALGLLAAGAFTVRHLSRRGA